MCFISKQNLKQKHKHKQQGSLFPLPLQTAGGPASSPNFLLAQSLPSWQKLGQLTLSS